MDAISILRKLTLVTMMTRLFKLRPGWRTFAFEISVVVCGILIALGLEQAVEAQHWRGQVREAREALAEELSYNAGVVDFLIEQDACVQARLNLLHDWSRGSATVNSGKLYSLENFPVYVGLRASAWEVAKTGEVAARIPLADRIAYGAVYDLITNQQAVLWNAREGWRDLARFTDKGPLDQQDSRRLAEDVAAAKALAERLRANSDQLSTTLRQMGVASAPITLPRGATARTLCAPPA